MDELQILRGEPEKRFYLNLFKNTQHAVSGVKKWALLTFSKRNIVEFTGMEGEFEPLSGKENSQYIYQHLKEILKEKNKKALDFEPGSGICMHVRLGDFTKGTEEQIKAGNPNMSLPIQWYMDIVKQIRTATGPVPVYVFSDGTDQELQPLLSMGNVQRITFGTAIADIMAMTKAKLFIASGSTFSRWVRYLGRMSTITYPGQLKQRLLEEDEKAFEIETETIPGIYMMKIKDLLNGTE